MIDYFAYLDMMAGIFPNYDLLPIKPEDVENEILLFHDSSSLVSNGLSHMHENATEFTKWLIVITSMSNTSIMKELNNYLQTPIDKNDLENHIYMARKLAIATNHAICTYDISPRVNSLSIYPIQYSIAITPLDFSLYLCIFTMVRMTTWYTKEDQEIIEIIAALIFLFRNILSNEYKYKKSIDISTCDNPDRIIDVLSNDWKDYNDFKYKKIDSSNLERIEAVNTIINSPVYKHLFELAEKHAYKSETRQTWNTYLAYINKFRNEQNNTIDTILADTAKDIKRNTIMKYMSFLESESFFFEGKNIDIEKLENDVSEIITLSAEYCYARSSADNNIIPINEDNYFLPFRFNSKDLIIMFHAYRLHILSPEELIDLFLETFDCLFTPILEADYSVENTASIIDKINYITTLITDCEISYKKYLPRSQSKDIHRPKNFISYSSSWKYTNEMSVLYYLMVDINLSYKHANLLYQNNTALGFKNFYYSRKNDELKFRFDKEFQQIFNIKKKLNKSFNYKERAKYERASILLASSHYIKLFIDTLKLIKEDKSLFVPDLDSTINSLVKINNKIDSRCFFNNELQSFRKENGIDTAEIELLEAQKDYNNLVAHIHSELSCANSIESLLNLKAEINHIWNELREDEKELYNTDFYEENQSLQNALYDKCQSEEPDNFESIKQNIKRNLGTKFTLLPENAIKPLCTAEYLYNIYVLAKQIGGFDYSGISSLYYQSLEALFNEIIWTPYAKKLNSLNRNVTGSFYQAYTSENHLPKEYMGYLPIDNRKYYIDKKNNQISTHLNLGSCYYILNDAYSGMNLKHWNHHLLETFGLKSKNPDFINSLYNIASKMKTSYEYRNPASHGGNIIDASQCQLDRCTVFYYDNNSSGIINMILDLITRPNI